MNNKNSKNRYYKFSTYLEEKFGTKVYKITLDAAFSCPNRDGTISNKGCIFCDNTGSFSNSYSKLPIKEQINAAILNLPKRYNAKKFISYFQAYTNTYADINTLKRVYDDATCDNRIVGISIGTRPDCVDEEKIKLISSYKNPWIEFGLQSIHNKTLELINRGHNYECFLKAYELCKKYDINVCVHVILGLFNETKDDMLKTAYELSRLKVDGVKFHMLTILKNSPLYDIYKNKPFYLLSEDEYCDILCDFLEILPPTTTIHRTAGTGFLLGHVAPEWIKNRFKTQNKIDKTLKERNTYQGAKYYK